jgi:hypothetical protein
VGRRLELRLAAATTTVLVIAQACSTADVAPAPNSPQDLPDAGVADSGSSDAMLGAEATCQPQLGGQAAPASAGGSRLRPIHWMSPDGLDVVAGVRDTLAGLDCTEAFQNGVATCVPAATPLVEIVSTEPTCATKALLGPPGLAGTVVTVGNAVVDALGLHVVWTGGEIVPVPTVYDGENFNSCVPRAAPVGGAEPAIMTHLYAITKTGAPLRQSAPIRRCVDPMLDALFVHGDDGSDVFTGHLVDHMHDPVAGIGGTLAPADDGAGATRWLPEDTATDCGLGGAPFLTQLFGTSITLWQGAVHELIPHTVDSMTTTNCRGAFGPSGATVNGFLLGRTIPMPEFELSPLVDVGGTRLRSTLRTAGGGPIVPSIGMHGTRGRDDYAVVERPPLRDLALGGQRCRPERATDTVVRCLPPDMALNDWYPSDEEAAFVEYSDAACTVPIAFANPAATAASPAPKMARELQSQVGSCSAKVYSIGAPIPRPAIVYGRITKGGGYSVAGSTECSVCINLKDWFKNIYSATYEVTGEVAAQTFAPMTEEVR